MTETELAWAAGLFEGEGSVRINPITRKNLGALLTDVANCDREIIDFFHERWGGTVKTSHPLPPRRTAYYWRLASREAAAFLAELLPYFRTERYRERALLGLAFQEQKISGAANRLPEYRAQQVAFFAQMAALNVRGVS